MPKVCCDIFHDFMSCFPWVNKIVEEKVSRWWVVFGWGYVLMKHEKQSG